MNRIIITAAIAVALAFSSCSTDDSGDDSSNKKKKSSSSRGVSSSDDGGNSSIGGGDSSSSGGENPSSSSRSGSNSNGTTKTYDLVEYDDETFTYSEEEIWDDYCEENGILQFQKQTYDNTVYYSIEDNTEYKIMTWGNDYDLSEGDTIQLKGSTAELRGTWTRTKNKETSCELQEGDDSFTWFECKNNYDITRAVFTSSSVTITRDECETDGAVNGSEISGWKIRIIDCNTVEYSKGSVKVTEKTTETSDELKYNGQTCKLSSSEEEKRADCKGAWDKYQAEEDSDIERLNYYYRSAMYAKEDAFDDCLKSKLPPEFLEDFYDISSGGGEDCEDDTECEEVYPAGKIAAKSVVKAKFKAKTKAKTKFTPLWKKKK
jgi:hypothetical protein